MIFGRQENIARSRSTEAGGVGSSFGVGDPKLEEQEFLAAISKILNGPIYEKGSKTAIAVTEGLINQYKLLSKSDSLRREFASNAIESLNLQRIAVRQLANVMRQKKEIKAAEEAPGEVDLKATVSDMEQKMGYDDPDFKIGKSRWRTDIESFGSNPNVKRGFGRQTHQDLVDEIKDNQGKVVHTMPYRNENGFLRSSYVELLRDARTQVAADVLSATRKIDSLIKTGQMPKITAADKAKSVSWSALSAAGGLAAKTAGAVAWGMEQVGKGIYYESDPNKSSYIKKYQDDRNKIFSRLLWNLDPRQGKNSVLMRRCNEILAKSEGAEGIMDEASFKALSDLITEEMKKSDQLNASKFDEYNAKINELNAKAQESAKDQTADADAMSKWRILQLVLIVTPFAGISVLGPVLNIFSGVFMNAGGLGQGLASLFTAEQTGPFGAMCEMLRLDEALRWLLCDMPVLSNIVDATDVIISSGAVQSVLGGIALPMLEGPLAGIALAGVFSLFRAQTEMEYHKKYGDAFKGHKKELEEEMQRMSEEAGTLDGKWDSRKFVDEKSRIVEDFHRKAQIVDYASSAFKADYHRFMTEIMGADFVKAMEGYERQGKDEDGNEVVYKIFENGKVNDGEVINFLNQTADDSFYDRIMLFKALERQAVEARNKAGGSDPIDLNLILGQFKAGLHSSKQLVEEEKTIIHQEYITQLADERGMDCRSIPDLDPSESDPKKIAAIKNARKQEFAKIEEQLKAEEAVFFKEDARGASPETLLNRLKPSPKCITSGIRASPLLPSSAVRVGGPS